MYVWFLIHICIQYIAYIVHIPITCAIAQKFPYDIPLIELTKNGYKMMKRERERVRALDKNRIVLVVSFLNVCTVYLRVVRFLFVIVSIATVCILTKHFDALNPIMPSESSKNRFQRQATWEFLKIPFCGKNILKCGSNVLKFVAYAFFVILR